MEAQKIVIETPKESITIIKEFNLELNNENFSLKIGKFSENEIYFSIISKNNSILTYESKYSLDDLCKINQSFRFFNSINDLINAFDTMINNKKIFIEKNKNDNLSIKLGMLISNFIGKEDKILIDLKMKELPEKEENKKLWGKIIELENKLTKKDEEIKLLNDN